MFGEETERRIAKLEATVGTLQQAEEKRKDLAKIAELPAYTENWTCPKCGSEGPHGASYRPFYWGAVIYGVCEKCDYAREMRPLDWRGE